MKTLFQTGLIARLALLALIFAIAQTGIADQAAARTWQVPSEAPTVAAAIDSAIAGDVIELAPGVYSETDLTLESGLTIRAADPESGATLDAGGVGSIFYALGGEHITLVGLTLIGGLNYSGGAARFADCTNLEIRDCTFAANRTFIAVGGALYVSGASTVSIIDCRFQDNDAAIDDGGGIWLSCLTAEITGCTFTGNHAINGGGISCSGQDVRITDCVFMQNQASNGAGIDVTGDTVVVTGCLFVGNEASRGGAAGCWSGAAPEFVNCTMVENTASDQGGALYCTGGSVVTVENSVLAFNADGGAIACANEGAAGLACSNVFGNVEGDWTGCLVGQEAFDGNFSLDPLFCARSDDTVWEVSADSPCLPGNNSCGLPVGAFGQGCGASAVSDALPGSVLTLYGAFPNPFNPRTTIAFDLQRSARVDLRVYDLSGRLVEVLMDGEMTREGRNEISWDGTDAADRPLPSGTFFCRLEAEGRAETLRMTLLK